MKNNNYTAIITGASGGLGKSFAKVLASQSYNLVLIARRERQLLMLVEELKSHYNISVEFIVADLSILAEAERVFDLIKKKQLSPEIFISNAGRGLYGKFSNLDNQNIIENLNLNVFMPSILLNKYLNMMKPTSKHVYILNVSSTISFRKSPNWAIYAAAKSFQNSLISSIIFESKKENLTIANLFPSKMDTDFDINSNFHSNNSIKANPDFIAEYALKMLFKHKKNIIPGFKNKAKYLIFKYLPNVITDIIVSRL